MGNINYIKANYINYYIIYEWSKSSNQNAMVIRLDFTNAVYKRENLDLRM